MNEPIALPLLGSDPATVCELDDGCITCGDVAIVLTVVEVGPSDAVCVDDRGAEELVATELIGPIVPGDRVLVHAKVALERLGRRAGSEGV
jgi:hydrogenase maturation factor